MTGLVKGLLGGREELGLPGVHGVVGGVLLKGSHMHVTKYLSEGGYLVHS